MGPCIQVKLLTFSRRQMSLQLPGLPYLPLQYLEQRSRCLGPEVLPRRRLKKKKKTATRYLIGLPTRVVSKSLFSPITQITRMYTTNVLVVHDDHT